MSDERIFRVVDESTGAYADTPMYIREVLRPMILSATVDHWTCGLYHYSIEGWLVDQRGRLALCDLVGNIRFPPAGMFRVESPQS